MVRLWMKDPSVFVGKDFRRPICLNIDEHLTSGKMRVAVLSQEDFSYDGPEGREFAKFLEDENILVNFQGQAVVAVPRRNEYHQYTTSTEFDYYLLEKVVKNMGQFDRRLKKNANPTNPNKLPGNQVDYYRLEKVELPGNQASTSHAETDDWKPTRT